MRVALLRGINVGGHRRVPMAELRDALEAAGLTDVTTYVQSGNVAFAGGPPDDDECATAVADAIEERFGFDVPVIIRTGAELRTALDVHPYDPPAEGEKLLHVVFCDHAPSADAAAGLESDRAPDADRTLIGRDVHVCYNEGSGRSKATLDWFEKTLGVQATARNLRTVRKLVAMTED